MAKDQEEKNEKEESSEKFKERMKLMERDLEVSTKKHEMNMKELEFRRESDRLHHDRELEKGRIFRAEEKKMIMLKGQEFRDQQGRR